MIDRRQVLPHPSAVITPSSMNGAPKYMSVEAMAWVLEDAPDFPPHLLGVLMGLANKADKHGRGAWPGQDLLAQWARKSDRAVRNDLAQLEDLKLIRRGDQSLVEHIVSDERPVVWDIAMERTRAMEGNCTSGPKERKPTSGRKHSSARKPADAPSNDAGQKTSTGSTVPGGSAVPAEGTGSTVQRDRKHTSADTSGDTPKLSLPMGERDPSVQAREAGTSEKPKSRRRKGGPKANRTIEDDQADELTNAYWERYTTAQSWIAIRQVVRTALVKIPRDDVARALGRLGEQGQAVAGSTVQIALKQINDERAKRNSSRASPGNGSGPRLDPNIDYSKITLENL